MSWSACACSVQEDTYLAADGAFLPLKAINVSNSNYMQKFNPTVRQQMKTIDVVQYSALACSPARARPLPPGCCLTAAAAMPRGGLRDVFVVVVVCRIERVSVRGKEGGGGRTEGRSGNLAIESVGRSNSRQFIVGSRQSKTASGCIFPSKLPLSLVSYHRKQCVKGRVDSKKKTYGVRNGRKVIRNAGEYYNAS